MQTEDTIITSPEKNHRKLLFFAIATLFILIGVALILFALPGEIAPPLTTETKKTAEEVRSDNLKAERLSLLAAIPDSVPENIVTHEEKLRVMKNIQTSPPADTISQEERLRILRALEVSINQ